MLDDEDVDFAILATWGAKGWWALITLILVVVMIFIVAANRTECSKMKCERGEPRLMNHECLCVEKPEEP